MKYFAPEAELKVIETKDVITASKEEPFNPDKPGLGEEERE